jgi:UDP-glucuronate decarboxylase
MARILITGGAGFIASSLAESLAQSSEHEITLFDNLLTGKAEFIPNSPFIHFIKCDVNKFDDISGVFFKGNFDFVFHYAAMVGVARTINNPVKVLEDIDGLRNILNLSKNTGVKRVFFSSSSEVYGEPVEIPQNELTTPLNSRLPYAIVKNLGEAYLKAYHQEYGLEYTIFRFFNTYGPKQSHDFVITRFINAALNNEDLLVYGDGRQTRTFCYIDDNIQAVQSIFESNTYINDVVNIGSDQEISILQLAETIISLFGSSSKIVHLPPLEEGDMTRRKPDNSKMRQVLGRQLLSLEEGLAKSADYFKSSLNVRN